MLLENAILRPAIDTGFLTKSITLYKYITPVALSGLIQHGDIKLTYRKDANDPYECLPAGYRATDKRLGHLGILSMTSNGNNHPMWGNYADKYRGACIKFKIPYFYIKPNISPTNKGELLAFDGKELKSMGTTAYFLQYWEDEGHNKIDSRGGDVLLRCEYSAQRSNPSTFHSANHQREELEFDQILYRQICTKHKDWEYEDEYRVTLRHSRCSRCILGPPSMYFTNAFTRYITKIVLGPNCEYSPHEIAFNIAKRRKEMGKDIMYLPKDTVIVKANFQTKRFSLKIPRKGITAEDVENSLY